MRHLAIISEHASPMAAPGATDAGRQSEYVGQIAERAVAYGYSVDVFTRRVCADTPEIVPWRPGVRVVHVDAGPTRWVPRDELLPFMGDFAEWMLGFVRRERIHYDVVHANYWMSGYVAAIVKRALGVPFVVTFHALAKVRRQYDTVADQFPVARPIIEERVVQEADALFATCPQDEQDLSALYDAPSHRIITIPCGVDTERFHPMPKPVARSELGLSLKGDLLVTIGRMVPQKGTDDIIRAVATLKRKYQLTPQLVVVGSGGAAGDLPLDSEPEEMVRLRRVARDEGVAGQVTFIGACSRDELRAYYCAADIFVTAPRYEPFGLTPLEAMACGTPVVGTRVGGLKLTVQHGQTGLLVSPQDPTALSESIARLLRSPEERGALSRQALLRARNGFSWSEVVARIVRVYADVTDRARDAHVHVDAPVLRLRPVASAPEYETRASA